MWPDQGLHGLDLYIRDVYVTRPDQGLGDHDIYIRDVILILTLTFS